jgi:phosphatidylglycerol lysyltransferase
VPETDNRSWTAAAIGAVLFGGALLVLHRELAALHYHELTRALFGIPGRSLALALLLTAANYVVLTGYDLAAVTWAGLALDRRRVASVSLISYAIANSVGLGMLSGASVRYRFYTRWGVAAPDLSRVVLFYTTTFVLGLLTLGGLSLALDPPPALASEPGDARALGVVLLLVTAAYALMASTRRRPLHVFRLDVRMPGPRATAIQFVLSGLDWLLAASVLWMLLPPGHMGFLPFAGAFVVAQLAGIASHLPGGLGVFETALVILCKPALPVAVLLPVLVVYRAVYYLLPFLLAVAALFADELWQRRHAAADVGSLLGAASRELTPRLLATLVFLAGALLLFSGATPAAPGRLEWLDRFLPLGILELSHFAGSVAGVALLMLSLGISRRLDASYYLTAAALGVGLVASLFKGADYEEATVLGLLLLALWAARARFDRRAAFFATRFSPAWMAAVLSVVFASVLLGFFSFKRVEYASDLWWQFALGAEASRFLRASVGAAVVLLAFGLSRLLRPGPPKVRPADDRDLAAAEKVMAGQGLTLPFLAFLGDKSLLFDEERTCFVMYGVQGRTWVALGDPVGPRALTAGLVRAFLERADDFDGVPVFYQATPERLHVYADFGLAVVKLGEEALVDLERFGLVGHDSQGFRKALARLDRTGARFRVVPREEVPSLLPELRRVSDDWLETRGAAEKGFSLGSFDERYLERFPAGILERDGRVEAFANLWPGPDGHELSSDLMRHRRDAPSGAMEGLLLHLMLWGKERGYRSFNLGMAPLSGLETSPVAPLWNRLASVVYERERSLYNFQGLRAFKEKFHPAWEPRYLAWPAGIALPRVMADISVLIAGGYRRMFLKGSRHMKTAAAAVLIMIVTAIVAGAAPPAPEESFTFGAAGRVTVYRPSGAPASVVLFVSGDGGWNQGVVPMAQRLRDLGALVVGIDIRTFLKSLESSSDRCAYPAGDLEELSRAVQVRSKLPSYFPPILVGYSSGATLVYAALASAPPETFAGAISLGFCPDLEIHKPLCHGRALVGRPRSRAVGFDLDADPTLAVPWYIFQGDIDQVCDARAARAYAAKVPAARLVWLPKVGHGFSVPRNWDPQFVEAYRSLTAVRKEPPLSSAGQSLALPLVEVPAAPGTRQDLMAVMITGDGGWAGLDKGLAATFAGRGIPVVGWNSLRYFWSARTPEGAAGDLDRILRHYLTAWDKSRALLVGYSFGADVLPFLASRLPPDTRARVAGVGLLGLDTHATFEFHVADWLGASGDRRYPTVPEVGGLQSLHVACVQGRDESGSACPSLPSWVRVITLPGGHHFDGDYAHLGAQVLAAIETPVAAAGTR